MAKIPAKINNFLIPEIFFLMLSYYFTAELYFKSFSFNLNE